MQPWRTSSTGVSIALRVTPRGGRDGVSLLSGAASRLKQVAVDGDPGRLTEVLRELASVKSTGARN